MGAHRSCWGNWALCRDWESYRGAPMSLFTSLQVGNNSLIASQLALQVTGNNIANANTEGYIRQRIVLNSAPSQQLGGLTLGLGVQVTAVVQQIDNFLEAQTRSASADLSDAQTREAAYVQLESLLGELNETDLSSSLTRFFNSVQDVLNQPENLAVRNLASLQGATLADDIRRLGARARDVHDDLNTQIVKSADDINRLIGEVARLNIQIVSTEGGGASRSDAVGLRDQRLSVLGELSSLLDVRALEQPDGSVTVVAGNTYLVARGATRDVRVHQASEDGFLRAEIRVADTDAPLEISSGKLAGLTSSRDEILAGFLNQLDGFAGTLAFEFNKVFSSGQGLTGYGQLTGESSVVDRDAPLDEAGLHFSPVNGSFQILVRDKQTGLTRTSDVRIALNGLDDDTTLTDLAAAVDNIDGVSASITGLNQLAMSAEGPNLEFAFANDSSGALAALGLNTFFTGTNAANLQASERIRQDPTKFAASRIGIGHDADNAVLLADFHNTPLESQNGSSLAEVYERLAGETTQAASVARSVAEGFRSFQSTLESQKLAISGVSIDEEAVRMIAFQRAFQASARFIATVADLLDVLVKL